MLVRNRAGNYSFLAAEGRPFSNGIRADAGYDLVHITFQRPPPLGAGLAAARRHVTAAGRPVQAIGGFELRIPEPFTRSGFDQFNRGYVTRLKKMGLAVGGLMPAARTNVAPAAAAPAQPSVFGFTYTVPGRRRGRAYLLSGVPEERPGDPAAMIDSILRALSGRLQEMGTSWEDATAVQLYGVEDVQGLLADRVQKRLGPAALLGIRWFPSRPPIDDLRLEIDVRSAGTELVLSRR